MPLLDTEGLESDEPSSLLKAQSLRWKFIEACGTFIGRERKATVEEGTGAPPLCLCPGMDHDTQ